jgi:hypothetical protein
MKLEKIAEEGIKQAYYSSENSLANALLSDPKAMKDMVTGIGNPRIFESGAKRDSNKGKIRPDLISPYMLKRVGQILANGANKYGPDNWKKGIPNECYKESLMRHVLSVMEDDLSEDHCAAVIFNIMGIMENQKNEGIPFDKWN